MDIHHLVKMVNEISSFFAAESGPERAPQDIANHLKRFWDPRMRREIVEHYRRGAGGLEDLARGGVALLAAESAGQQ